MEPQLVDTILELIAKAVSVRDVPFSVDYLECDILYLTILQIFDDMNFYECFRKQKKNFTS